MDSFLLGGIIGVTLALLNFLTSIFVSTKVIFGTKLTSVALALGGFLARLTVLSLLFYALSKVRGVHFQTALVSFIFCFTLCLILKTVIFYRRLRAFPQNRTEI